MAPKKETSVELCSRVNAQGNTIAIRMLEYLSTAKHAIPGFQPLATEFIELCQVLWSIEAGLTEVTKSRSGFPVEVAQELDKRVRQVHDEFSVLSQMVNKCMSSCIVHCKNPKLLLKYFLFSPDLNMGHNAKQAKYFQKKGLLYIWYSISSQEQALLTIKFP